MSKKLGQEPAFHETYKDVNGMVRYTKGMNKRFYAACAAMQGILANQRVKDDIELVAKM